MAQLSTMNQVFDIISQKNGIIGIYARPGMGKTTFMLQIVDEVNKRKDGTALVFSMAESQAQLIKRMQQINVSCDRVVIDDIPHRADSSGGRLYWCRVYCKKVLALGSYQCYYGMGRKRNQVSI